MSFTVVSRKCSFSTTEAVFVKDHNNCKLLPFWKEEPILVSSASLKPWIKKENNKKFGADWDVLKLLSKKVGFRYHIHFVRFYTDIIRMVDRKDAHIAISQPSMTAQRNEITQFLTPMSDRNLYFFFVKPSPKQDFGTLFFPFEYEVWFCILASLCVMAVAISFIHPANDKIVYKSVTIALTAMIQESCPPYWYHNHSRSRQVLFWIWIPTAFVICLAYKSNLLASLVDYLGEDQIKACVVSLTFDSLF